MVQQQQQQQRQQQAVESPEDITQSIPVPADKIG
jgi:hypothetical protein